MNTEAHDERMARAWGVPDLVAVRRRCDKMVANRGWNGAPKTRTGRKDFNLELYRANQRRYKRQREAKANADA